MKLESNIGKANWPSLSEYRLGRKSNFHKGRLKTFRRPNLCTYSSTNISTKKMVSLLSNSDTEIQNSHFRVGVKVGMTYFPMGMAPYHTGYKPYRCFFILLG